MIDSDLFFRTVNKAKTVKPSKRVHVIDKDLCIKLLSFRKIEEKEQIIFKTRPTVN